MKLKNLKLKNYNEKIEILEKLEKVMETTIQSVAEAMILSKITHLFRQEIMMKGL